MEQEAQATVIKNMGVLDLTGKKTDDLSGISLIENVGVILAPHFLSDALMNVPQKNVGMTVTIPETEGKIKILTGQLSLSGEVFANRAGSESDILVIAGQTVITSGIEKIGFSEIIIAGQLIAPKKDEAALAGAVTKLAGQLVYYHSQAPRLFLGDDQFSKAFFELMEEPMSMLLIGSFEIESDVDVSLLKQKVNELIVIGTLSAPKDLIPLLKLLATTKLGDISAKAAAEVQSGQ